MDSPDELSPAPWVESDAPEIAELARALTADAADDIERAVRLYRWVRDEIAYDPYDRLWEPEAFSARRALRRRRGFCIPKAGLLAAAARVVGIRARIGFADVRNHLASPRLIAANNGDVFRWHAYAELFLEGRWVKATPAFDAALCQRARIEPLAFDGRSDSVFHAFDRQQRKHMEYVLDRGPFTGVPVEAILATWRAHSPALFDGSYLAGARAFQDEVQAS